jgi:hypothetical protein
MDLDWGEQKMAAHVRRARLRLVAAATAASMAAAGGADVGSQRDWPPVLVVGISLVAVAVLVAVYAAGPVRLKTARPSGDYVALTAFSLTAAVVFAQTGMEWRYTAAAAVAMLPNWFTLSDRSRSQRAG